MDTNGIPLDKAELLATILEGTLYGKDGSLGNHIEDLCAKVSHY